MLGVADSCVAVASLPQKVNRLQSCSASEKRVLCPETDDLGGLILDAGLQPRNRIAFLGTVLPLKAAELAGPAESAHSIQRPRLGDDSRGKVRLSRPL
jgi:hypothetical protein